jgi:hypothetical protein
VRKSAGLAGFLPSSIACSTEGHPITASSGAKQLGEPDGRFSRRRALGAIATGSLAAGLGPPAANGMSAQNTSTSTQLNPDGTTPFNVRLGASQPVIFAAGMIRITSIHEMPRIDALGIQLVEIAPGGVREVHWHPNAAEINDVLDGGGIVGIPSTSPPWPGSFRPGSWLQVCKWTSTPSPICKKRAPW